MIALRPIFLLLAATALLGCEEDLAARDHFEIPFSMYGVLSPDLDTQSVRVYAIEDFPTLGSDSIDAIVTSRDLTTGEVHTWKDSLVVDPDGQREHIFWSPFRAAYGHRYHVEVSRPTDDARSYAEARVPLPVIVQVDQSQSPNIYVAVEGAGIQALKPEAVYILQKPSQSSEPTFPILPYSISYAGQQEQVANGWMVHIRMHFDRDWVTSWYLLDIHAFKDGSRYCPQLILHDLRLRAIVGDSIWNPHGGVFDRNVLSHPKTMSNVENGFGFVGAGYRIDESLKLSQEAVENACFYYYDPTR